jgi:hypothetical protein
VTAGHPASPGRYRRLATLLVVAALQIVALLARRSRSGDGGSRRE